MEEYAVYYPPNGMNYTLASSSGSLEIFFFLKYIIFSISIASYVLLLLCEIH